MDAFLMIGEVLKPQGVKGEVKVRPITQDDQRFVDIRRVYVRQGEDFVPRAVTCTRVHGGFAYLLFDGVADRDRAEDLRGLQLYVDRAHAIALPENMNFICDLIGCALVDTQGADVGILRDVLQPGANDVYVLDTPRGEVLLPALKAVVLSVDVGQRRIVVDAEKMREVAVFQDSPVY